MSRFKKVMALAMAGVLTVGCLAGCGSKKTNNQSKGDKVDVEISAFISGMGEQWLKDVVAAFNEKYPEYNAFYTPTASYSGATAFLGMEDVDTVDVYMSTGWTETSDLASLDDVLDSKAEGETKTIREKFNQYYLAEETRQDGSIYSLTHGAGIMGFVYNVDLFEEAGITQIPRTSDELAATCAALADKKITPLLHHKGGAYYTAYDEVWIAQAMGEEAFLDFYTNPTKEKFLEKDGRYEVLKAMAKIITPEYVLAGSNTEAHTVMQTKFLAGDAAMTINGSWLQNEMGGMGEGNFLMMKTPVISGIKNRLETVKSDRDLREVISAIDAVTDGEKTEEAFEDGENYKVGNLSVSASDWKEIKKARNASLSADPSSVCFIPRYTANMDGAKQFLKFLYSDEGLKVYANATHCPLPLSLDSGEYDMSDWSDFEINQYQLKNSSEWYIASDKRVNGVHDLFVGGGARIMGVDYPVNMCTNSESQRKTADDFWNDIVKMVNSEYDSWLANIK